MLESEPEREFEPLRKKPHCAVVVTLSVLADFFKKKKTRRISMAMIRKTGPAKIFAGGFINPHLGQW